MKCTVTDTTLFYTDGRDVVDFLIVNVGGILLDTEHRVEI